MQIILWRHADAEDPGPAGDLARNLTKKGRRQAQRMADWLRPRLEGDWKVLCSPANRALQTLEPLGLAFETRPGLAPEHTAQALLREAGWPAAGGNVLVVGHNPTFGEAAAMLLGGPESEVAFRKGAIWWFATRERDGRTETVLKAVMETELLESP